MGLMGEKIVDHLPVGVTLTTFGGRLLRANPEAYRLLELDPNADVDVWALYPNPDQRVQLVAAIREGTERKRRNLCLYVRGIPAQFHCMSVVFNGMILSAFWRV